MLTRSGYKINTHNGNVTTNVFYNVCKVAFYLIFLGYNVNNVYTKTIFTIASDIDFYFVCLNCVYNNRK